MQVEGVNLAQYIFEGDILWEKDVPEGFLIKSTGGSVKIIGNIGNSAIIESKNRMDIIGNIGEKSTLKSGSFTIIKGNVSAGCILESQRQVEALDIGDDCKITALMANIRVQNVGDRVELIAMKGLFHANKIGNQVKINTGFEVSVKEDIGNGCHIEAGRHIFARNIGDDCEFNAAFESIIANDIGNRVKMVALQGKFRANKVGEDANIQCGYDLTIAEPVPPTVRISQPKNGMICIAGQYYFNEISPEYRAAQAANALSRPIASVELTSRPGEPIIVSSDLTIEGQKIPINVNVPAGKGIKTVTVNIYKLPDGTYQQKDAEEKE